MQTPQSSLRNEAQIVHANRWWEGLTDAWKQAFNEVALQRSSTEPLGEENLLRVYNSPNHRFAGPSAPYPNMSFELEDMSGLVGLPSVEVVVVIFHQLKHVREVAQFSGLRSLFVYNNQIASLEGLEGLRNLKELYCNVNQISSLVPLAGLTELTTLYCNYNQIADLDGIGEQHTDILTQFYCLPNPLLKQSSVLRFERAVGIRCQKG